MKNREIESAKELMLKALVKLGANEEFAQEIADEAESDFSNSHRNEFVVNGVMHTGRLIHLANKVKEEKKVIYGGQECICSPKRILYLCVDDGVEPTLAMKKYDALETFDGSFIGASDVEYHFVALDQLNWAACANFN